jgi:hypothetical protein
MFTVMLILNIILFLLSCVSSYYAIKFGLLLLKIEDEINDSLSDIDTSFKIFNEILQKPIFFDSVEVRQCVNEIKRTRQMIIRIANRLTSVNENIKNQEGADIAEFIREEKS